MRYSIIHHDIRQQFGLSLFEYIVCDSVHQLSHKYPTTKSTREIGSFVGIDFTTISRCIIRLKEKGLVIDVGDGLKTSEEWFEAVTNVKRENATTVAGSNTLLQGATKLLQGATHTTNKEYKEYIIAPEGAENIKPKKDTTYLKVFELWGKYPLSWRSNKAQIQAAKNLLSEQTFEDIQDAVRFSLKHKDDSYCPEIHSPWDLDTKWSKLEAYYAKRV